MSQVDAYTIPASPLAMMGLATRLEELFAAVASANRGSFPPDNPFEGMFWWDTSATPVEVLKRYTVTAGWVSMMSVNITTGVFDFSSAMWTNIKKTLKPLFLQAGAPSVSDSSGTIALDFATYAGFYCILSGTGRTVTFTNPTEGQVYRLLLIQGSGGSKTITTWPTMTWLGGGSAPTLSTTEGKADAVTIWYVNGVYYGSLAKG